MAAAKSPPNAPAPVSSTQATGSQNGASKLSGQGPIPVVQASHTPTPAQQNPQVKRALAPYLPEANPDAPTDPGKAMAERERNAIANAHANKARISAERAGVDGAAPPPKPKSTPNTSGASSKPSPSTPQTPSPTASDARPSTEATSTPSPSTSTDSATTSGETSTATPKGPRYDFKSVKKWAEEHPEEAAELRPIFGADQNTKDDWIKLTNRKRKLKEEIRSKQTEVETTLTERQMALEGEREKNEQVVLAFQPVADLWGAAGRQADGTYKPDFIAIDAAFIANTKGLSIDDYVRIRARNRVPATQDVLQMRAENARLQRELASAKQGVTGAVAKTPEVVSPPATQAPATAPVNFLAKWDDEVPKAHKLRQLAGWPEKLERAMDRYHDAELDEYSKDPEDVADAVLRRELAAFSDEDETEHPKKRAAAPSKPNTPQKRAPNGKDLPPTPKGHRVIDADAADKPPADLVERERWAIGRARKRAQAMARGEVLDE